VKALGVNRVIIAVKDLDKAVDLYTKLLGCTFEDQREAAKDHGVQAALSWDAGIEMVAPLPGVESAVTMAIEQQGEGLMGVIFDVEDVEESRKVAEELGIAVIGEVEFNEEQIKQYHHGRFKKYKEYYLNPENTHGVFIELAQIQPKYTG